MKPDFSCLLDMQREGDQGPGAENYIPFICDASKQARTDLCKVDQREEEEEKEEGREKMPKGVRGDVVVAVAPAAAA